MLFFACGPPRLAPDGSVYFRGTKTVDVTMDARWIGQQSFYVRHGDWFVAVSAALVAGGYVLLRSAAPAGRRGRQFSSPPAHP